MKFSPACNCCGSCTGTVTAAASCNGTTISGATFKLIAADGTTVLATLTGGTSVTFTSVTGGSSYYVEVSKTGYHTKRSTLFSVSCGGTPSITVSTWPTAYDVAVHVQLYDGASLVCPLSGASVSFTGDGTGSGTTDSAGDVSVSVTSGSTSQTQSLSYSITPPSGHGAAVKTGSISVGACAGGSLTVSLDPSAGHVRVICNTRYMPEDMEWEDDYGSCTVTYTTSVGGGGLPGWEGNYTYSSTRCFNDVDCFGLTLPYPDSSGDVTAYCRVYPDATNCGDRELTYSRDVNYVEGVTCVGIGETAEARCQPTADAISVLPPPNGPSPYAETVSCGSSLSFTFTLDPYPATTCGEVEETGVDVTLTGTIA